MLSRLDFFAFFFYVTGAWDRLKVFEVHVLVSPKVRRGRQGLRRNSPGRPHQHGKPEKRKRENPLRSARLGPAVALLWKAFEICRDASVAAAARVRLPLASLTSTAVLISPSTAQMKSVSGGGRWELIHGFTSVTDMLEVKRK